MPLPVTFANLPTGNNPASTLDQNFAAVAAMATTYCGATGTNNYLLTVGPNQPAITSLVNGQHFSFIASATNTGPSTIQVGSLAAIPVHNGGQPLTGGEIIANTITEVMISASGAAADLAAGGALPLAGGTINGVLTAPGLSIINPVGYASLNMTKPVGAFGCQIATYRAGTQRWLVQIGDNANEPGSGNAGSNFSISRYTDGGVGIDVPISIARTSGVTTFSVAIVNGPSDRSLKENIEPIGDALAKVLALQGVAFNMKTTPDKREIGLIAQDVEPVVPEVIQPFQNGEAEGKLAIDYPRLVAVLVEAIKTLTARVEALETKGEAKQ